MEAMEPQARESWGGAWGVAAPPSPPAPPRAPTAAPRRAPTATPTAGASRPDPARGRTCGERRARAGTGD